MISPLGACGRFGVWGIPKTVACKDVERLVVVLQFFLKYERLDIQLNGPNLAFMLSRLLSIFLPLSTSFFYLFKI